ncbi:MAG: hypothetical protein ACNA71_09795 [Kiritimatiellia bacterium]
MIPDWIILDAIGPFFRDYPKKRVNWSKIPFPHVAKSGWLEPGAVQTQLIKDFKGFLKKAQAAGYNTITLDDLVHLLPADAYQPEMQEIIATYRSLYSTLFENASARNMRILITSDVFSLHPDLAARIGNQPQACFDWLATTINQLLADFPAIAGIIFRIGESDSIGTKGTFLSKLLIRTPEQANTFLKTLLPVFEHHDRSLFFRTWTVGAYSVGDLIWHHRTFQRVFKDISSENLIISMKPGESDFFRFLPLNTHFFRTSLKTIVELQTRPEYEGFGEYPSFTGWEHERILQQLQHAPNCVGTSVWCQTGGWGKFKRLTWIHESSVWTELNTHIAAALCQGSDCDTAIRTYAKQHLPKTDPDDLITFLALADDVIREGLYIREFATRKLFFRRLRVPPLLFPYWDRIMMSPAMRRVMRSIVENQQACVQEGWQACKKIRIMQNIAKRANIPEQGLAFQHDTFQILALLREYVFADPEDEQACIERLKQARTQYRKTWKPRYAIKCTFAPHKRYWIRVQWWRRLLVREQRGYRLLDSIITLRLLAILYPMLGSLRQRMLPKFARKQAMGIDSVFK